MVDQANTPQDCPICGLAAFIEGPPVVDRAYDVVCQTCGHYVVASSFWKALRERVSAHERMKVASVIFERRMLGLSDPDVDPGSNRIRSLLPANYESRELDGSPQPYRWDQLLARFPSSVSDRLDRCLVLLGKLSKAPGVAVEVEGYTGKVRRATFSEEPAGMEFVLEQLAVDRLIKQEDSGEIVVRAGGWNRIADIERERGRLNGKQAFVAMRFSGDKADQELRAAISSGIKESGYEPIIVDEIEHAGKICDRIIAEIRKSRFLVADFTGHRQNVYYEAGFAQGLGLSVIWTCRKDEVGAHFDTRQYSHILWETPKELKEKLALRIQAMGI